ncbi:uncharacterized protein TRIADDRAFT_53641 [Trichoplax adhaerens]|uniref:Casein kinase substrate phosphoprotein PP28 domain-containing protein n=1 Tax=Trichoplax adhaerens TaxID=10228 RepID=B3RPS0_TRIAD|nr:hypothetical protein TRIADDRAFT_53641 [Trichoplax adhaerens]EDV28233.1 hypothetical protein TRIADDRAFT_53641 [Trichoplax adhaerens]|eukprot:XP_002110067.1 hypothetical protein TRIADDRAFT_53641 [Trichoplax adhaerens]
MPKSKGKSHKGKRRVYATEPEELKPQQNRDLPPGSDEEEEDEESGNSSGEEGSSKAKGVEGLIDIENPNRAQAKVKKVSQLDTDAAPKVELSRREREEIKRQQDRIKYEKLRAEGKTEEARADLARLAIIRKEREAKAKEREASKKAAEEKKSTTTKDSGRTTSKK